MTLLGNHKNCFFSYNCPECDRKECLRCSHYAPVVALPAEELDDQLYAEMYGFMAGLRVVPQH